MFPMVTMLEMDLYEALRRDPREALTAIKAAVARWLTVNTTIHPVTQLTAMRALGRLLEALDKKGVRVFEAADTENV